MDLVDRFVNWAKQENWTIEFADTSMRLPEQVNTRYKTIPEQWFVFIVNFTNIINSTGDVWFLTCENYLDEVWNYDSFENIILEAAEGNEKWSAEIKSFWDNTFPIILSVGGDYQYFAIKIDSGKVIQGYEPEFEDPLIVADSFNEFLEKIISGEIELWN